MHIFQSWIYNKWRYIESLSSTSNLSTQSQGLYFGLLKYATQLTVDEQSSINTTL